MFCPRELVIYFIIIVPTSDIPWLQLYLPNYGKTYCFDTVFNEDASQTSVYAVSAQPAMRSFVSGTSAAILAYGQTGAGKTFTMGTDCTRGDLVSR